MANTLDQFKNNMAWTMIELPENKLEEIYNSVDSESYATMEDLEKDYNYEDNLLMMDVNLHSVIENHSEIIERGMFRHVTLYYLKGDDIYASVYHFDY